MAIDHSARYEPPMRGRGRPRRVAILLAALVACMEQPVHAITNATDGTRPSPARAPSAK